MGKHSMNHQLETNHVHHITEEEVPWKTVGNPVATLEMEGRYVDIGNMDKHFPKLTNMFSVLSESDVDEYEPMKVNC